MTGGRNTLFGEVIVEPALTMVDLAKVPSALLDVLFLMVKLFDLE